MTVAMLGNGVVGQVLARGLMGLGHDVVFGSRHPEGESSRKALAAAPGARVATYADAARAATMAVLATPWSGTENAIHLAGPDNLAGKLVIDAVNPLESGPAGTHLAIGQTTSAGELVQSWLPQSRVVKAFNTVGAKLMVNPQIVGGPPTMFIAGNDASAKSEVLALLTQFGWDGVDIGGIEASRLLEPMAMLWITYAMRNQHWTHAFRLLGR